MTLKLILSLSRSDLQRNLRILAAKSNDKSFLLEADVTQKLSFTYATDAISTTALFFRFFSSFG